MEFGMVPMAAAYFGDDPNLIQEYQIMKNEWIKFQVQVAESQYQGCCCYFFGLCLPCWFLCEKPNLIDKVKATHVAITRDGVRFSVDKHPTGCRLECQEQGKVTKTVPFDKITDCDIEEPGGSTGCLCFLVKNTITVVNIDTASSGGAQPAGVPRSHELQIMALADAKAFKQMVWDMKRSNYEMPSGPVAVAPSQASMSRTKPSTPSFANEGDGEVVPLLRRQNELLEEHTRLLQEIARK